MQVGILSRQNSFTAAFASRRALLGLVLFHSLAAIALSLALNISFQSGTSATLLVLLKTVVPAFLIFLMFWRFGQMVFIIRPDNPTQWALNELRETLFDTDRIVGGTLAFLTIAVFAGSFTFVKEMIPAIDGFPWDPSFAAFDRLLHGGLDPYRLLLPLFGTPLMTTAINAVYHFWFFLMYFMIFIACFGKAKALQRNTFLMSFVLTWAIGGNLLAIIFASGGPVYYQPLGFGDDFVPQLELLREFSRTSPVWALDVHEMLLDGYLNDGPVRGISAMPSMHVASAVLMTLFAFQYRRWAGWLMVVFTILIQIGSVHLAWHYAIDGYIGLLVAVFCWYIARSIAYRFQ